MSFLAHPVHTFWTTLCAIVVYNTGHVGGPDAVVGFTGDQLRPRLHVCPVQHRHLWPGLDLDPHVVLDLALTSCLALTWQVRPTLVSPSRALGSSQLTTGESISTAEIYRQQSLNAINESINRLLRRKKEHTIHIKRIKQH